MMDAQEALNFVSSYEREQARMRDAGLGDILPSKDACGVGCIVSVDGKPKREVVVKGIQALKAVWHRGAVDADGKTGDGAGLHIQIPHAFFQEEFNNGQESSGDLAVGMVFLPRESFTNQEVCRSIVEMEILKFDYVIRGWRQVPVDTTILGAKAAATRPEIEQIVIENKDGTDINRFESDLYVIRRKIEKRIKESSIQNFYICSLSCRSIIYKGLFLAENLTDFYQDLNDERFASSFALFHQRYSTNTMPSWDLAQPFRTLAHNGEINTFRGNANWMKSHETRMSSDILDPHMDSIRPVLSSGSSDSAALDAVMEVLIKAGRSLPMSKCLLIPPTWTKRVAMPQAHRDLFSYCNCVMEPWDGPAAVAATDNKWIIAGMDRNGLRPMRYSLTQGGLLVIGSETGMVPLAEQNIIEKGRVGPGEMIGVNLEEGKFYRDAELKDYLSSLKPYSKWVSNITHLDQVPVPDGTGPARFDREELRRRQALFDLSLEDMELILAPMVTDRKEAVGSMGDDTPLAVLSKGYRGLHHFFRQQFSQVTNPPIDPLREYRVMSLKTRYGNLGNIFEQAPKQTEILQLESPCVTTKQFRVIEEHFAQNTKTIDCTFEPASVQMAHGEDLRNALHRIMEEAAEAVAGGCEDLILTDEMVSETKAPIPMILATGAIHAHLVQKGLRAYSSITVRSGECLDTHYFAVLIGVGATAVNAYLAEAAIADRHERGLFPGLTLDECLDNYVEAVNQGLLKIMSKMGISIISSYRGGYNFEAVGLSRALVYEYFPGLVTRISGIGLTGISNKLRQLHQKAFAATPPAMSIGGFYRFRRNGEKHALEARLMHQLQHAVATDSYAAYKRFSEMLYGQEPTNLRDLLDFRHVNDPIPLEEVESITEIRKRFVTPGMSLGALSPEAHETLTIAMNRIGAKADSGEGGEGAERFSPRSNGDNPNSSIKQVASGRFGVTAQYLNACKEIEIKVAQGAKPGEGGQLPGFKVTAEIARLRHSTQGVTLISPPPHHDIYSIEDLAQLIYDLKQINQEAKVCVKLVSETGIGTIAAGVAKAKADVILVSGYNGGTGASPQTSIKFAGTPWEMGLSETNQVLTLNNLRHRVLLRTDGGLKTGRDIVIAALLGAEEYGIGTLSLVAMGCLMVRQCHSNTCPVGVCTQDSELRKKFDGTPEKVVNLMSFIAEEVREILSQLGLRSLDEAIGRSELLKQVARGSRDLDDLDLNPLLCQVDSGDYPRRFSIENRNKVPETLDAQIVKDAAPLLHDKEKMQLTYNVRNVHRAVGTLLSSHITKKYGMMGLEPGHLTIRLRGSTGQSLGAFAVQGLKLEVFGDANDYVGKGLSGGMISVRPLVSCPIVAADNVIIGNTCLYGATAGELMAAGRAGERFAVRNSGAVAVVEGCGDNGCEYMTGGKVAILGPVGDNFAAGMSGGLAYLYDPGNTLNDRLNRDMVTDYAVTVPHYVKELEGLLKRHFELTKSAKAEQLMRDYDREICHFKLIVPNETLPHLSVSPMDVSEEAISA